MTFLKFNAANADKVIVVFGVTGNQGGSSARALLKLGFKVVGITRNVESPRAKDLGALGIKLHQADLDNVSTYAPALEGAYGAFLNLDYWAHYDGTNALEAQAAEEVQGDKAIAALAASQIKHVVYSTLESVSIPLPHFDSKDKLAKRLRAAGVPTTLLYTSYYYSNVLGQIVDNGDHVLIANPLPDNVNLPSFAVEQTGLWVAKAFEDPKWIGKDMYAASQNMTVLQVAQGIAKITGRVVKTKNVTEDEFAADKDTDREWYTNCVAFHQGLIIRDVETSKEIVPVAWGFLEWAEQNEAILKLRK